MESELSMERIPVVSGGLPSESELVHAVIVFLARYGLTAKEIRRLALRLMTITEITVVEAASVAASTGEVRR
jgi:hypothetical protein